MILLVQMFPGHDLHHGIRPVQGRRSINARRVLSVARRLAFTRRPSKFARLDIKRRGELKRDGTGGGQLSDSSIELRGFLRVVGIGIFQQNFDGFPQFGNGRHRVPFFLVHMSQEFEKGYAPRARREILAQKRFGQPVILPPDRLVRQ